MASRARYVAFLRAINVGGHIVKMDALKAMFEAMGYEDVATFIASGNVIFRASGDPARLEAAIAKHLEKALGYPVATFVRSIDEIQRIATFAPFSPSADGTLYVGFLASAPAPSAASGLTKLQSPTDRLRVHAREVYWLCATGLMQSSVSYARVEKVLGVASTFRNINTVRRLAAKYATPQ